MYENKTYEDIKESILKTVKDIDKREGSFINDMVSPVAMELEGAYQEFNTMLGIMFLEDNTGEYLEKRANEYGIKRKQGTYSTGEVTFTGVENAVIPKGSLVSTTTNLLYETVEEVTIQIGHTSITVAIKANSVGNRYNVLSDSITQIPVAINGVTGVTNTKLTLGGTNVEKDDELLTRTLMQIQNPATSGNAIHYKLWALEVNGVGDAKVFPLHNGNGTVKVMPITSSKRSVDDTIINNVTAHIESEMPIGATVTVQSPTELLINVNSQIILDSNYTLQQVIKNYTDKFKSYIEKSVFNLYTVDYYKCLSMMYDVAGVKQVVDFKLNNATTNISIQDTQIQVAGTVTMTE